MKAFDIKISIIGSCQVRGMAEALRASVANVEVVAIHVNRDIDVNALLHRVRNSDLIISQIIKGHSFPELAEEFLTPQGMRFELLPTFIFDGFHPDACGLDLVNGGRPPSPLGGLYHSRIVACAFALGLSSQAAANLLNADVFAALGYFEHFAKSKERLFRNVEVFPCSADVKSQWDNWMTSGCFMHTPSHPNICVLTGLAVAAATRAGLCLSADLPQIEDSFSMQDGFPLYSDLAQRWGVRGQNAFRSYDERSANTSINLMDSEAFAERSFGIYTPFGRERIAECAAIEPLLAPLRRFTS